MGNKAENLINSIKLNCDVTVYNKVKDMFADVQKSTTTSQGNTIKSCLKMLNENNVDAKTVMRNCNCLSASVIKKAKECFDKANGDISICLQLLNDKHIGGGQLHISDNGNIIGVYSQCYCSIPKAVKDMPSCYCECSAGWFEKLFSNILGKEVEVNIIHTILSGNSDCVFEIIV